MVALQIACQVGRFLADNPSSVGLARKQNGVEPDDDTAYVLRAAGMVTSRPNRVATGRTLTGAARHGIRSSIDSSD